MLLEYSMSVSCAKSFMGNTATDTFGRSTEFARSVAVCTIFLVGVGGRFCLLPEVCRSFGISNLDRNFEISDPYHISPQPCKTMAVGQHPTCSSGSPDWESTRTKRDTRHPRSPDCGEIRTNKRTSNADPSMVLKRGFSTWFSNVANSYRLF